MQLKTAYSARHVSLSTLALTAAMAGTAFGSELDDRFTFHGYGHQQYLQTNANEYDTADKRGSWDKNFLCLITSVAIDPANKVWAQVETSTTEETYFSWFFLDHQFSENLRGQVGRVKMPIGLYNELIDAQILQVGALLPSLYEVDMTHDAYQGVGLSYQQDLKEGNIHWQIYGGNNYNRDVSLTEKDRRILGGRVTYQTPVDGLRFMLSSFRTQVETLADKTLTNEDRSIFSIDYTNDKVDFKSEYAVRKYDVDSHAYYVQLGYNLNEKWEPYVRYDSAVLDTNNNSDPSYYQNTKVVGVGYKATDSVNFRFENHFNQGYGLPVAAGDMTAGTGKNSWDMFVASVNFMF